MWVPAMEPSYKPHLSLEHFLRSEIIEKQRLVNEYGGKFTIMSLYCYVLLTLDAVTI